MVETGDGDKLLAESDLVFLLVDVCADVDDLVFPPGTDIICSTVFLLGGLPGPRFVTGAGGGIDIDSSCVENAEESVDDLGENSSLFSCCPLFCPFFIFVVKVVGLSSV